jgi:SAM-dependent methyltransferase
VWADIQRRWGATFPAEYRRPWDETGQAVLYECGACGLHYFSPLLPADGKFFELIAAGNDRFYVDDRWEFQVVLDSIKSGESLIDFGSGEGAFLRLAANKAGRVLGCDYNEVPSTDLSGAELRHEPFDEVAADVAGTFDVATSFHVLEHVIDVADLCEPAVTALRKGGHLFLSTPDRQRTARNDLESLDCPPHHISRWSKHQYERLAARFDLDLIDVWHEPFVHPRGVRRYVPQPALDALGLVRNLSRGVRVHGPRDAKGGPWPRGAAILVEFVKR